MRHTLTLHFLVCLSVSFVANSNSLAEVGCGDAFRPVVRDIDSSQKSFDPFSPFVAGYDPIFEQLLRSNSHREISFQTLEFNAPAGIEIKDDGFLPAFRNLGRRHRVITDIGGQVSIDRNPSVAFLNEVREFVFKAAVEKYTGVIPESIIQAVERAEQKLPSGQSAIGIVRDRESGVILGTIRIYPGLFENGKVVLPSTQVLRELGSLSEAFDRKLLDLAFGRDVNTVPSSAYVKRDLIEVGQLSINPTLKTETHEAVRNMLFQWVELRLQEGLGQFGQFRDPLLIAHVAGRKHAVLYRRQFGIKDSIFSIPNSTKDDHEAVLSIDAGEAIQNSAKTRLRKM
jgi:hypothetical protein